MDRLKAIEIFSEVARGRSFTAAALRLGMAKGNVTKHVKWLEETLGAQLLDRSGFVAAGGWTGFARQF